MAKGGKRPGAGRRVGSKNKATLEKAAIQEAFNQRVMVQADSLFNAQLSLAVGSVKVFEVVETKDGNRTKREHFLVTNTERIKEVLDGFDGVGSGVIDDTYYLVSNVLPDNRAIDSMLNRALGKPKDTMEYSGIDGSPIENKIVVEVVNGSRTRKNPNK